jgi:GNAT superfamily N-acetyltransferase
MGAASSDLHARLAARFHLADELQGASAPKSRAAIMATSPASVLLSGCGEEVFLLDAPRDEDAAADAPVGRALDALAAAYQDDPLAARFAAPGCGPQFLAALLAAERQHARFKVCCAGDYEAAALMRELKCGEDVTRVEELAEADAELAAGTAEGLEGGGALEELGVSYLDALLRELREGAAPALRAAHHEARAGLDDYMRSHEGGCHVMYCEFAGTAPPARGRGLAHRLLAHLVRAADARGAHLYVEVARPEMAALLEKEGFLPWRRFRVEGGQGAGVRRDGARARACAAEPSRARAHRPERAFPWIETVSYIARLESLCCDEATENREETGTGPRAGRTDTRALGSAPALSILAALLLLPAVGEPDVHQVLLLPAEHAAEEAGDAVGAAAAAAALAAAPLGRGAAARAALVAPPPRGAAAALGVGAEHARRDVGAQRHGAHRHEEGEDALDEGGGEEEEAARDGGAHRARRRVGRERLCDGREAVGHERGAAERLGDEGAGAGAAERALRRGWRREEA